MNVITYNGQTSESFRLIIAGSNSEVAAARSRDEIVIPGRSGSVIVDNGSFLNVKISYDVVLKSASIENIMAIARWLLLPADYAKLQESDKPEYYRMAIYDGSLETMRTELNEKGKATLTFNCKPQKYLLNNGEEYVVDIPGDSFVSVENVGLFGCWPLFEITFPSAVAAGNTIVRIDYFDSVDPYGTVQTVFQMEIGDLVAGKTLSIDFAEKTVLLDGAFPSILNSFSFPTKEFGPGLHSFALTLLAGGESFLQASAKVYPRSWTL